MYDSVGEEERTASNKQCCLQRPHLPFEPFQQRREGEDIHNGVHHTDVHERVRIESMH